MPKFAANLSMMYTEHDFMDRFAAAAADGFKAVEYLFPYDHDALDIRDQLWENELQQVLFNAPPGDWAAGERGFASAPGREAEFEMAFDQALYYADELNCRRVHVMAGIVPPGVDRGPYEEAYRCNLEYAAKTAVASRVDVLIEPINQRDMPGYFISRQDDAHRIVQEIGAKNLKVQFDLYHCQIVEGDLTMRLRGDLPTGRVGHIQIAGVPDRHEPDEGEVDYPHLFRTLDDLGYQGWVGCEYRPRGATSDGLGWLAEARKGH